MRLPHIVHICQMFRVETSLIRKPKAIEAEPRSDCSHVRTTEVSRYLGYGQVASRIDSTLVPSGTLGNIE